MTQIKTFKSYIFLNATFWNMIYKPNFVKPNENIADRKIKYIAIKCNML